jgi:hypothetical protein
VSVWRRKASEMFYDLRFEFQGSSDTIYSLFFALLPRLVKAHEDSDINTIKNIYEYSEWCFYQRDKNLWNAVSVGLYEHLADKVITLKAIPYYIKPDIFFELKELYKQRLSEDKYMELLNDFNRVNGTDY